MATSAASIDEWPRCYRCHKPWVTCICARVPRVENRTPVWILQHPRERFHPVGTARIANLGLANMRLQVCHRPSATPPPDLPPGAALLFPSRDARGPSERPRALVVLDGTWSQARTLLRDNAWLQALPRWGLSPSTPSRYRIRKEPRLECLSTIEAIVQAMSVLEPDTEHLGGLLGAFEAMIDDQLRIIDERHAGKRRPAQTRHGFPGVPRVLLADAGRLVVTYCEVARALEDRRDGRRCLVHWTAVRPATGAVFDEIVAPATPGVVTDRHLHHMRLDLAGALGSPERPGGTALPVAEVAARWQRFLGDGDVLVAWNQSTLDMHPLVGPPLPGVLLKTVYCTIRRGRAGMLEEVMAREGLAPVPLAVRGRACQRLGNAAALLAWTRRGAGG